eukprot:6670880-Alexandrium_andersonii.AAC.1
MQSSTAPRSSRKAAALATLYASRPPLLRQLHAKMLPVSVSQPTTIKSRPSSSVASPPSLM